MYRVATAADTVKATEVWSNNKLFMMVPTVMNVASMAVLAALLVMG